MNAPTRLPAGPATPARARFVHLKVHSAYSLLEGALPIGKLAKLAAAYNFPAVGLTDTNNLYGALEFSDKLADSGMQPIVGVTLTIDFEDRRNERDIAGVPAIRQPGDGNIALLAMDEVGYANLMKLVSRAHLDAADVETAHTTAAVLAEHAPGLIALTGGPDGPVDRALRDSQSALAEARLDRLKAMFGDRLYVEIQRHGLKSEHDVEPQLLKLAYAKHIPIVATNETYFATPDDYEAHDALLCIAGGRYVVEDDRRRVTREHDFKSAEAMADVFADLPEALDNTIEIAKRCAFRPMGRKPILPRFVAVADEVSETELSRLEAEELRRQAEQGLAERLAAAPPAEGFATVDYEKRLAYELDVIARMKFPGYFLIVADFIKWAKAQGIPVGPGRGSGAGSVVAWALTITDLDPLRFGLLFERFLNPERVSMPDFDIDFCQDRRDEVIRYVQRKYGHDRVAQIITHGKLQARAVLRDVGRVLQMPYGQVDRLCKLVPNNPANPVTLPEAIAGEPKLQEQIDADPMVARLVEIAQKLEGLYRHASTHAAGMVIGDRPLVELVPLTRDPKTNSPVTQFNWKLVEAAGLVKFDFLGLKTLTVLQKAVELVKRGRGIDVDLLALPFDDPKAFEILAKADTVGVFQLESTGMRESLKRLKPDRFEDIIAMVALYRPGPMDNIPTYINRKHGEEPIDCLHPLLVPILKETYGVIIYQEQVIQIAQVMGGFTLGQADNLRRAMGKKDKAGMAKEQERFVAGAVQNGVKKNDAADIFLLVDKFAGYGFNKSHAAAYALVSYHTAYMKANYREEFLAASMTLDMSNTDKLAQFASEARRSGISVRPPSYNASAGEFLAEPPKPGDERGAIRYGLAALKNIGTAAVETIVESRNQKGLYKSLEDIAARINSKAINKRALETLAAAGAFDEIEPNRALVYANVDSMLTLANWIADNSNDKDLFATPTAPKPLDMRPAQAWTPMERLSHEFDAVGFYLSGHPLDQYELALKKLGVKRYVEFEAMTERGATSGQLAGIVIAARERRSQKGNKFAFGMFSDATGQFEAVIFSDTLATARDLLEPGTPVLLGVSAERDGDTVKMRVESLASLNDAVAGVQRGLRITLDRRLIEKNSDALAQIKSRLKPGGKGEIRLVMALGDRGKEVEIVMPGRYDVSPTMAGILSTAPGVVEVLEI
ncbi:MAG: DNA polymerase III subunit alpha [Hyphomicrobium sp.]|nr:DNA polymerase III subunit alpha [Hyphomicrobium sp.]